MKKIYLLTVFCFSIALFSKGQTDGTSLINMGSNVGQHILGGLRDKKKSKIIQSSLSPVNLNGQSILILRVKEEEIMSPAKSYVLKVQRELDAWYTAYKNGKHVQLAYYFESLNTLISMDKDWPADHYQEEFDQYRLYENNLTRQDRIVADRLELVQRAAVKRETDSLAYVSRTAGYHFIAKDYSLLKEKPETGSATKGRIYAGSYVKVIGTSEGASFVKVALEDVEGYLPAVDVVNDLDKIPDPAELSTYKSRYYYRYEPDYNYRAQTEKVDEEEEVAYASPIQKRTKSKAVSRSPRSSSRSTRQSSGRQYITGPRGGCYYIAPGGGKVYVDHSYCR